LQAGFSHRYRDNLTDAKTSKLGEMIDRALAGRQLAFAA